MFDFNFQIVQKKKMKDVDEELQKLIEDIESAIEDRGFSIVGGAFGIELEEDDEEG